MSPARSQRLAIDPGALVPRAGTVRRARVTLPDGAHTTVYVARYARERVETRLVLLRRPRPLAAYCAERGVTDAVVGGFFARPGSIPLGELRTRGMVRRHEPFDAPWHAVRPCVHIMSGQVAIAPRDALPAEPRGDLLQAGPLLVHAGARAFHDGHDREGFSAGARQFDSDITVGRHPRAALALAGEDLLAVVCDGRSRHDVGLQLAELTELLLALGADAAINLDGGGSTSLVAGGRLRNRPRSEFGVSLSGGRPITTALTFAPRA